MSTRLAAAAAVLLFALGAVVQIWSPRLGLTLMLLGVLAAFASTALLLRGIQRRLVKHERFLTQLQKSVSTGTKKVERSLAAEAAESAKGRSALLREVRAVQNAREATTTPDHASAAAATAAPGSPPSAGTAGAGRAATPEVTNPFTDETLHSMLSPRRLLKIAGLYTADGLPDHEPSIWTPGEVVASLERVHPDLVLIDEQALRDSPVWSSATTAVGTALMQELLGGVTWAQEHRVLVYLLPSSLPPDVHSSALRHSAAVVLPLTAADLDAAAGAPQTSLLHRLQELAAARMEGAS